MTANERRGTLIPIDLYVAHLSHLVVTVRSKVLSLPARVAPKLVGLERHEIRADLDSAVRVMLTNLAQAALRDGRTGRRYQLDGVLEAPKMTKRNSK